MTGKYDYNLPPPIFIIGTQRSGTTLLCRMLEAHPAIYIRNEVPNIRSIFSSSMTKIAVLESIDKAMIESFGYNLKDFLNLHNKPRWGIKDPDLRFSLDHIIDTFPESKIIFIIRDGRAVANSFIKNKWGLGVNVYYGSLTWEHEIKKQLNFLQSNPRSCHLVRYEDLITNTKDELKRVLEFIEEPFSDILLEYYKYNTFITKKSQSQNVYKKPDEKHIHKWKQDLTFFQINVIETVVGDTLVSLGYHTVGNKIHIPRILKLWFYIHQMVLGEIQIQYQWRIKGLLRKSHIAITNFLKSIFNIFF
jgi:hypothetical protein